MKFTEEQIRKGAVTACIGICLLMSALNWMLMKFGGIFMTLDDDYTDFLNLKSVFSNFRWIVGIYFVAEVTMIPVTGRLIDYFGEKKIIAIAVPIFFIGAVFSGCAWTVSDLLIFRGIQGLGAGMIFAIAFSFVGRAFKNPHKRNMPHEVMTAAFAVGSLFGTMVGYWCVFNWNYHYALIASGFVMAIAGTIAYKYLPEQEKDTRKIDYLGLALMTAFVFFLVLFTQVVNHDFKFISWESFEWAFGLASIILVLIIVEKGKEDPAFPMTMKRTHVKCIIAMYLVCLTGVGLLQYILKTLIIYYSLSIYSASLMLFILLAGGAVTSVFGCKTVTRIGVRFWVVFGSFLLAIGFLMMGFICDKGVEAVGVCMFVMGLGFGCMVTELLCGMQAFTPRKDMAVCSSTIMGLRMTAIAVGNAIFSAIILARIKATAGYVFDYVSIQDPITLLWNIELVVPEALSTVKYSFSRGVMICAIIGAASFVILSLIGLWMRDEDKKHTDELPDNSDDVVMLKF